jgi:hypothetical protein
VHLDWLGFLPDLHRLYNGFVCQVGLEVSSPAVVYQGLLHCELLESL